MRVVVLHYSQANTMFKKPRRNFRARQTQHSESGDENIPSLGTGDHSDEEESTPAIPSASSLRKLKKKKKHSAPVLDEGPAPAKSTLSFGEEINDGDAFKVKKSSRSKHIAKQLKKESRRDREEQEKRNALEKLAQEQEAIAQKNGSAGPEDMDLDEPEGSPSTKDNGSNQSASLEDSDEDSEAEEREREEETEQERKRRLTMDRILQSGAIPDAHMIHMARKKRQQAREMGDFVPLEEPARVRDSGSRLIREEDHDNSEDDDEPLSFSVNTREKELRKMQESIIKAQEESNSEDSDKEREWEEQQIRKGVNIPQVPTNDKQDSEAGIKKSGSVDKYLYAQSSSIFNPNGPELPLGSSSTTSVGPTSGITSRAARQEKISGLPLSLEGAKKSLQERLESLSSVHRAHVNKRDDLVNQIESCESSITQCENSQGRLEDQYRFFQEMRGYVRDLVECLNEKVPSINFLERSMNHRLRVRAEGMSRRRQEDLTDQSDDVKAAMQNKLGGIPMDPEKQRRVAEREARRARRRRAREAQNIRDHHEGMSTDDEENQSHATKFKLDREQIEYDCRTMFNDTNDDFARLDRIRNRFEAWKQKYSDSYEEAYIGLCLPKLFNPFVRLELILWNPIEECDCTDFEEMDWYESLMFYGYREGEQPRPSDPDLKLIPSLIEKVLLPKLTDLLDNVWDPLSSKQTRRVAEISKRLIRDYPSITAESKNTQDFLRTLVRRLRKTLSDDVFIPLCTKQMMENKNSPAYLFSQRQFWTCIKLLTNLMVWQGMLSDKIVKELTLDSLLNRYLLLGLQTALQTSSTPEVLYKSQALVACLPKPWFGDLPGEKTLQQLTMLCHFLNNFAESLGPRIKSTSDAERKEARDYLRQITKMFVTIHAMDHAVGLSEKFSFKL